MRIKQAHLVYLACGTCIQCSRQKIINWFLATFCQHYSWKKEKGLLYLTITNSIFQHGFSAFDNLIKLPVWMPCYFCVTAQAIVKNIFSRKISTEEKRNLGAALTKLSPEDLTKALEIVAQNNPSFQATAEEVDLDIDAQVIVYIFFISTVQYFRLLDS